MKRIPVLIALALCVLLAGCTTILYDSRSLESDASLNAGVNREYTVVKSFKINDKAGWVLGLIPVNKPAGDHQDYLSTLLAEEIRKAGGDAVINVKLRAQNQFLDFLVTAVTLGVYAMRTVTVTGDVIRYQ